MTWKKTPPETVAAFDAALPVDRRVDRRKMFGFPAAFVNGNMFAGTFEDRVMIRIPGPEQARFLRTPGAAPFEPMPGRVMKDYLAAPPAVVGSAETLREWIATGYRHALALAPKVGKSAVAKTAARGHAAKSAAGKKRVKESAKKSTNSRRSR